METEDIRKAIDLANRAAFAGDDTTFRVARGLLSLEARRAQWAAEDAERELDRPIPYTLTARARLELSVPSLNDMQTHLLELRREAYAAGDERQADLCSHALDGCSRALIRCALVLHEARSR